MYVSCKRLVHVYLDVPSLDDPFYEKTLKSAYVPLKFI